MIIRPEGGVDKDMYAALHGLPGVAPLSFEAALDLDECAQVSASRHAASARNHVDAQDNDPRRRPK